MAVDAAAGRWDSMATARTLALLGILAACLTPGVMGSTSVYVDQTDNVLLNPFYGVNPGDADGAVAHVYAASPNPDLVLVTNAGVVSHCCGCRGVIGIC